MARFQEKRSPSVSGPAAVRLHVCTDFCPVFLRYQPFVRGYGPTAERDAGKRAEPQHYLLLCGGGRISAEPGLSENQLRYYLQRRFVFCGLPNLRRQYFPDVTIIERKAVRMPAQRHQKHTIGFFCFLLPCSLCSQCRPCASCFSPPGSTASPRWKRPKTTFPHRPLSYISENSSGRLRGCRPSGHFLTDWMPWPSSKRWGTTAIPHAYLSV